MADAVELMADAVKVMELIGWSEEDKQDCAFYGGFLVGLLW